MARVLPGLLLCFGIALLTASAAALPGLVVLGPLTLALLAGIGWRAVAGLPAWADEGSRFAARPVLRLGVCLMGARLDYALVGRAGPRLLVLDLVLICAGIVAISLLARRLAVPSKLATLLAVGTSICGASAVVAAGSVTRADEDDVTLAVGLCGIVGTAGVLFYVLAGPHLGVSTTQLAVLCGSTLHEVAQVVAAGFTWGPQSGDLATLVKLARVVLLAPALVVLGLLAREPGGARPRYGLRHPPVPWFVIGFLALGGVASAGLMPPLVKEDLSRLSVFLMGAAMAAMGLHTHAEMIRRAGPRVIYAGLLAFAAMAALSWTLIHLLGIA